ncbi:MAG: hypothetical protein V3V46_00220 [Anaerolineales bacterium]
MLYPSATWRVTAKPGTWSILTKVLSLRMRLKNDERDDQTLQLSLN